MLLANLLIRDEATDDLNTQYKAIEFVTDVSRSDKNNFSFH
jgi:hypothetical protein